MKPPPGTRLYKLCRAWLSPADVDEVLEPAVADLQYEAEHASTARERRMAIRRGHAAIVRALLLAIEPGGAVRATAALCALCAIGTLLVTTARAAHGDGRVVNSAMLAPGMLAPLILRMLGTTSPRRLFVGSLVVAVFTPVLAGGVGLGAGESLWARSGHAVALIIVFAPMAAGAAIVAAPDRETVAQRAATAVSLGSGIATATLLLGRWPQGEPLSTGLAMTPFYVALFAVLFALTLLPLLLLARALGARPVRPALTGLGCSPLPLIAGAYIDHGTLTACLAALRHTPLSFAAWSLPFILGAMVVGWRLPPSSVAQNSSPGRS